MRLFLASLALLLVITDDVFNRRGGGSFVSARSVDEDDVAGYVDNAIHAVPPEFLKYLSVLASEMQLRS